MAGPRWVRLDIDYFDNPKTVAAGRDGRDMHLASICWVARFLTDGHIPPESVPTIARHAGVTTRATAAAVGRVVDAGLWIPNGHGFELHDFLAMNSNRDATERQRDQWRIRQQRKRDKGGHFEGDKP